MNQLTLIDDWNLTVGQELKRFGMQVAADAKKNLLELARLLAIREALKTHDRCITADDVLYALALTGIPIDALGNAAGSLFRRPGEWTFTGQWRKSERVTNHARMNRVWRYDGPGRNIRLD